MYCSKCGRENSDSSKFCQGCGNPLHSTSAVDSAKVTADRFLESSKRVLQSVRRRIPDLWKNRQVRVGVIAAVCLVVLIVLAGQIPSLLPKADPYLYQEHILQCYSSEVGQYYFILDDQNSSESLDVDIFRVKTSVALDRAAILSTDDELYSFADGKFTLVAKDIREFLLSDDGTFAFAITTDDRLLSVNLRSASSQRVDDDVDSIDVISPDGKSVLYQADGSLYAFSGDKQWEVNPSSTGLSISDQGRVYFYSDKYDFIYTCSRTKNDPVKICSNADSYSISHDGNEFLFSIDGYYYLSIGEKDRIKLIHGWDLYPVLPSDARYVKSYMNVPFILEDDQGGTCIVRINNSYEIEYLVKRIDDGASVTLTKDAIYYMKSDRLCRTSLNGKTEAERLASDVYSYALSPDGKTLCFIDTDNTLYRWKKNDGSVRIADDVRSAYASNTGMITFLADCRGGSGTLSYNTSGKKCIPVNQYVYDITSVNGNLLFWAYDDGATDNFAVLWTLDGTKAKKIGSFDRNYCYSPDNAR